MAPSRSYLILVRSRPENSDMFNLTYCSFAIAIGSTHSYFPAEAVSEMGTSWLLSHGTDVNLYYNDTLDKSDLIFGFQNPDRNIVEFRCQAKNFLDSPMRVNDQKKCFVMRKNELALDKVDYFLGMVSALQHIRSFLLTH